MDSAARALPVSLSSSGATVESCIRSAAAQGLAYAGLQFGGECFGGDSLTAAKVSESECNMPCSANPSEICGAGYRNSVYVTGLKISISPSGTIAAPGTSLQFSAQVRGAADTAVTWRVQEGGDAGTVSSTGLYTAPMQIGTYHVVVTTHATPPVTATATVSVSVPGECASLPKSGTWENISPPGVTDTTAIAVDPFDPATLWAGTNRKGFYKSTDCGANWIKVNTGALAAELDTSSLWSIRVDPVERGTIYLVGGYGAMGLFKSTNGGVDWKQMFKSQGDAAQQTGTTFVQNVSLDPANHRHVLITIHDLCKGAYGPACTAESTDGGETWKIQKVDLARGWAEGGGAYLIDSTSWIWCDPSAGGGSFLTTSNGSRYSKITPTGGGEGCNGGPDRPMTRAADGAFYLTSIGSGLYRSTDAYRWTQVKAGRYVGFATGTTHIYLADQWTPTFVMAPFSDLTKWTRISPPPIGPGEGMPYMEFSTKFKVLYASGFAAGLWRRVMP